MHDLPVGGGRARHVQEVVYDFGSDIHLLPQQRQNLMFSATYSEDIRQLASRILRAPQAIDVAPMPTKNNTAARTRLILT